MEAATLSVTVENGLFDIDRQSNHDVFSPHSVGVEEDPWMSKGESVLHRSLAAFIKLHKSLVSQTHALLESHQKILELIDDPEGGMEVLPTLERFADSLPEAHAHHAKDAKFSRQYSSRRHSRFSPGPKPGRARADSEGSVGALTEDGGSVEFYRRADRTRTTPAQAGGSPDRHQAGSAAEKKIRAAGMAGMADVRMVRESVSKSGHSTHPGAAPRGEFVFLQEKKGGSDIPSAGNSSSPTRREASLKGESNSCKSIDFDQSILSDDGDDRDARALAMKLELSLKGRIGNAEKKAAVLVERVLWPDQSLLAPVFREWKAVVHGTDIFDLATSAAGPVDTVPARKEIFPLHPHGVWRVTLDVLGLFVILYDMFMIPVYLAFSQPPGYVVDEPAALGTFTRLFWTTECIISFNTAYHDHFGQLILDRVKCFKNHLKTWFIVDLLTVGIEWLNIVLAILMENSSGGLSSSTEAAQLIRMARIARIVRMFRLLRILKLRKLIHGFYDQLLGYMEWVQLLLQIGQTLMMVLVLIHAVGCMWYGFSVNLIGSHEMTWVEYYLLGKDGEQATGSYDDSLKYHYFTALHFALAQVSPGNINIMPMNWSERVMNICILCLTLIVFSSFISSMTVAVTRLRNINSADEKRHALLRKYFRDHDIPSDLAIRVHSFLDERHEVMAGKTNEREVDLLPLLTKGLQSEITRAIKEPTLRRYPVLRQLHSSEPANDLMVLICAEACSERTYGPGDKVYVVDDVSRGMYFLTYGVFDLREYSDHEVESFKVFAPVRENIARVAEVAKDARVSPQRAFPLPREGTATVAWLSEFSLFAQRAHDTMLIAESYCQVLQVSRQAFLGLLRQFPLLHEVLAEANRSRYDHAVFVMGSEASVGDWIRPRSHLLSDRGRIATRDSAESRSDGSMDGIVPAVVFSQSPGNPARPKPWAEEWSARSAECGVREEWSARSFSAPVESLESLDEIAASCAPVA